MQPDCSVTHLADRIIKWRERSSSSSNNNNSNNNSSSSPTWWNIKDKSCEITFSEGILRRIYRRLGGCCTPNCLPNKAASISFRLTTKKNNNNGNRSIKIDRHPNEIEPFRLRLNFFPIWQTAAENWSIFRPFPPSFLLLLLLLFFFCFYELFQGFSIIELPIQFRGRYSVIIILSLSLSLFLSPSVCVCVWNKYSNIQP